MAPSRGRSTALQVRAGDFRGARTLLWRDLYVRAGIVSTVPGAKAGGGARARARRRVEAEEARRKAATQRAAERGEVAAGILMI